MVQLLVSVDVETGVNHKGIKQYPKLHIMVSEEIEYEVIQILKEINPVKKYINPYRTNRVLYGVPRI